MPNALLQGAFKGLDGFGKTLEDVKVRTRTGAFITMLSAAIILTFTLMEVIDYRRVNVESSIQVDTSRDKTIAVKMNITFPRVPCYLLSLDITDISGDIHQDVSHNILKTRLDSNMQPIHENTLNYRIKSDLEHTLKSRPAGYCGSCYGAQEVESQCCQTCEDVRQAYLTKGWSFDDPNLIEQCVAEHWTTHLHEQSSEGCRLSGRVRVSKATGNFNFSPGRSFLSNRGHAYDLVPYLKDENHHDFGHHIHSFHFEGEREVQDEWMGGSNRGTEWRKKVGLGANPLEETEEHMTYDRSSTYVQGKASDWMFQYFLKVVSTDFEHLDGDVVRGHQYSVTKYVRDITRGNDFDRTRDPRAVKITHGYEGLPGAFFHFEFSPMLVLHKETQKSFAYFMTSLCAVIGGVLTLASIVDSVAFATLSKVDDRRGDESPI